MWAIALAFARSVKRAHAWTQLLWSIGTTEIKSKSAHIYIYCLIFHNFYWIILLRPSWICHIAPALILVPFEQSFCIRPCQNKYIWKSRKKWNACFCFDGPQHIKVCVRACWMHARVYEPIIVFCFDSFKYYVEKDVLALWCQVDPLVWSRQ